MTAFLIEIPQSTGKGFGFRANLSGVQYRFEFAYCTRDDSWSFDLLDASSSPICEGIRCQVGIPALAWLTDPRKPPGSLCFVDTSGKFEDPGIKDLGGRVLIAYDDLIEAV